MKTCVTCGKSVPDDCLKCPEGHTSGFLNGLSKYDELDDEIVRLGYGLMLQEMLHESTDEWLKSKMKKSLQTSSFSINRYKLMEAFREGKLKECLESMKADQQSKDEYLDTVLGYIFVPIAIMFPLGLFTFYILHESGMEFTFKNIVLVVLILIGGFFCVLLMWHFVLGTMLGWPSDKEDKK